MHQGTSSNFTKKNIGNSNNLINVEDILGETNNNNVQSASVPNNNLNKNILDENIFEFQNNSSLKNKDTYNIFDFEMNKNYKDNTPKSNNNLYDIGNLSNQNSNNSNTNIPSQQTGSINMDDLLKSKFFI